MASVSSVVNSSVRSLTPVTVNVPEQLWDVYSIVHRVHWAWGWFNKFETYSNPNNFHKLVAGHTVSSLFGDNIWVRVAAQCVLIATRIFECIEEIKALAKAYKQWINAIFDHYSSSSKMRIRHLYSKDTNYIVASFEIVGERIKRIAIATFEMLKAVFRVSMRIMDTIAAFSTDREVQNQAVNEVFVNSAKFLDSLVENQNDLIGLLYRHKKTINEVLSGAGAEFAVEAIIEKVEITLKASEGVQKVAKVGDGILKDFVQNATFGAMQSLGLSQYTPEFLVPEEKPEWLRNAEKPSKPKKVFDYNAGKEAQHKRIHGTFLEQLWY